VVSLDTSTTGQPYNKVHSTVVATYFSRDSSPFPIVVSCFQVMIIVTHQSVEQDLAIE
jgi:hypothetical protein